MLRAGCSHLPHAQPGTTGQLLKGTWLADHYYIEEVIAVSKLSTLYRATTRGGQTVILKEGGFSQWRNSDPQQACAVLQREAMTLRALSRLRVLAPRCLDLFHARGRTYLVMNFVPGETLAARLKHGGLTTHETTEMVRKVACIVSYVHAAGYVHQDVKPLNVQVCPNGMVMLLDYGAAMPIGSITDGISGGMATPGYASPAQIRGHARPSNDVFALGAMLDELIPKRSQAMQRVIDRAMSEQSYTTIVAFLDDLKNTPEAMQPPVHSVVQPKRLRVPVYRRTTIGSASIGALILIGLLLALSINAVFKTSRATNPFLLLPTPSQPSAHATETARPDATITAEAPVQPTAPPLVGRAVPVQPDQELRSWYAAYQASRMQAYQTQDVAVLVGVAEDSPLYHMIAADIAGLQARGTRRDIIVHDWSIMKHTVAGDRAMVTVEKAESRWDYPARCNSRVSDGPCAAVRGVAHERYQVTYSLVYNGGGWTAVLATVAP